MPIEFYSSILWMSLILTGNFISLKSSFLSKSLSVYVILLELWSFGSKYLTKGLYFGLLGNKTSKPVITTPLCTFQRRRWYVPNGTPNDVSVERPQEVVLLYNISKGRNNDVSSVRLRNVSNKSQMKHPTTSQWHVTKMSRWYISTTSH